MKKLTLFTIILVITIGFSYAQQEKGIVGGTNWLSGWTEFRSGQENYGEPTQIITGNILENTTLTKRETYLLVGNVFVIPGVTLTIEPGTVIMGDNKTNATLTVAKGGTIIANGTETDPIVFTSNKGVKRAGDWGGIILLGEAPINKYGSGSVSSFYPKLNAANYRFTNYGGDNSKSSSGILKYVRIEYAGKRVSVETYFNGLLLASVGSETQINNVMVSNAADDAFEVWGGDVKLSNLVSYRAKGTDYKFNHGSQGVLYNSLAVRSPYSSNIQKARSLEVLSYDKRDEFDFTKAKTTLEVKNVTLLNESDNFEADMQKNLIHEAVYVGDFTQLNMVKSVISGYNPAVIIDSHVAINQQTLESMSFREMYFNNCSGNIYVENNKNNDDLENWYGNRAFFNVYSKGDNVETFISPGNNKRPDYRLRINKIIATNVISD